MPKIPIAPIRRPVDSDDIKDLLGSAMARPPRPGRRGTRIGDFELQSQLGAGTYATCWRAVRHNGNEEVALKVLDWNAFSAADRLSGALDFWCGATIMGELERAGDQVQKEVVVPVREGPSTTDAFVWYAMRLLEDGTLRSHLESDQIAPADRESIADELIALLRFVHQRGLTHGDLRPENVFVQVVDQTTRWLLADLEVVPLARAKQGGTKVRPDAPRYSPSDAEPRQYPPDLYALTVIIFELYAGSRAPLPEKRTTEGFLAALPGEDNPGTGHVGLGASTRLRVATFCAIGTASDPALRFKTIGQLERVWKHLGREPPWTMALGIGVVSSVFLSVGLTADWLAFRWIATPVGRWTIAIASALSNGVVFLLGIKWWETYSKRIVADLPVWRLAVSRWVGVKPWRGVLLAVASMLAPVSIFFATRFPYRLSHYSLLVSDGTCTVRNADGGQRDVNPSTSAEVTESDHVSCTKPSAAYRRQETWVPLWTPDAGIETADAGIAATLTTAPSNSTPPTPLPDAPDGVREGGTPAAPPPPTPRPTAGPHPDSGKGTKRTDGGPAGTPTAAPPGPTPVTGTTTTPCNATVLAACYGGCPGPFADSVACEKDCLQQHPECLHSP
jgi:hypothetical protein